MALSDVTKDSVLKAVEEYRTIGQNAFLKKYGFGKSTRYLLRVNGEDFDSKAIVGAAHGYVLPEVGPLANSAFSGGKDGAAGVLKRFDFDIVEIEERTRNPLWTRDELILATEFYKKFAPQIPGKTDNRLMSLADEIRSLAASLGLHGDETFRNPNGVYMKLMELKKYDPEYVGKGLGRKPRAVEQEVWDLSSEELAKAAQSIREVLKSLESGATPSAGAVDTGEPEVAEAAEGALVTRFHRYRERDTKIAKSKKKQFLKKHGRLYCEACNFDFAAAYGDRGEGFIECHHTVPVSEMKPGDKTKLSDLTLVCANCHRMIHAKRPWLSIPELVGLLRKKH